MSNILLVDDEPNNRNSIIRLFEEYDIEFSEAENGQIALDKVRHHSYDMILLDIKMPVMNGFDFLEHYAELNVRPKPTVCVMTAFSDHETRRKAIYLGADDFINKPLDPIELETRIASLLRISHYQQDLNQFNKALEELVTERTRELRATNEKLKETEKLNARAYREMLTRIAKLAGVGRGPDRPDPYKLGICAAALGWILGMPSEEAEHLSLSAQVYNIGLLALPEKLREAPTESLSKDQLSVLATYTILGSDIFKNATSKLLQQAYNICLYHQEHFDGTGYPHGKRGEDIPLEARLFAAAFLIVETIEHFPENPLRCVEHALQDHANTLLDPAVVSALLESPDVLGELIKELTPP